MISVGGHGAILGLRCPRPRFLAEFRSDFGATAGRTIMARPILHRRICGRIFNLWFIA